MNYYFIVNPVAGRGRALRAWQTLQEQLRKIGLEFDYSFTDGPGHATELAKAAAARNCAACIGVGGDGTLHEMLPGLINTQTALGCVPAGTGNDFARSIGIPRSLAEYPAWLTRASSSRMDVPYVNSEAFLNVAGTGFDAVVADTVNKKYRWLHGTAPYLLAVFQNMIQYHNAPLTIELDDHPPITQKTLLVAAGNMQYYGGGIRICPQADPADGQLDFCIAGNLARAEIMNMLPKTFSGRHLGHPKCLYVRAAHARISGPPLPLQADGQIIGTLPALFTVKPGALRVLWQL